MLNTRTCTLSLLSACGCYEFLLYILRVALGKGGGVALLLGIRKSRLCGRRRGEGEEVV